MTRSNNRTGSSATSSSSPPSPSLSQSSSSSSSSCCSDQSVPTPPRPPPQQQQKNDHPQYDIHQHISTSSSSSSSSPILSPSSNSPSTVRRENAIIDCRSRTRSRRVWRRRWWWIPVSVILLMILWTLTVTTTTTTLTSYLPRSFATTMKSSPPTVPIVLGNERSDAQQRQQQHHNLHQDPIPPQRTYRVQDRHPDLHVVVAYCRMSINWIFDEFLKDFDDNHHDNFDVDVDNDGWHGHQHISRRRGNNPSRKIRQPQHYKQPLDRIKTIWIYSKCQSSKSKSKSESGNDDGGSAGGIDEDQAGTNDLNIFHERLVHFFKNRIKNKRMISMANEEGVVKKHRQRQTQQQIPRIIIDSSLPNVGRCDHTYAYWMSNYAVQTPPPSGANNTTFSLNLKDDDEVLFIKDNNNKDHVGYIQLNTFQDMENLVYRSRTNNDEGESGRKRRSRNRARMDSNNGSNLQLRSTIKSNKSNLQHGHADEQRGFGCSTRISWKGWNQRAPDIIDATTLGNFHLNDYVRDFHKTHSHSETNSSRHDGVKDSEEGNLTSNHLTARFESPHRPLRRFVEEMKMDIDGVVMKTTKTTTSEDLNENHGFQDVASLDVLTGLTSERTLLGEVVFVPICYCGSFLTTVRQIRRAPIEDWSLLLQTLSRGDNIEEGHYMERLWAALLSNPLSFEEQKSLRQQVVSWDENGTPFIDPTKWIENTLLIR